jgi:WD40 repeat protein
LSKTTIGAALVTVLLLAGCRGGGDGRGSQPDLVLPTPVTPGLATTNRGPVGTVHPRRVEFDPVDDGRLLIMERNGDLQLWRETSVEGMRREVAIPAEAIDARFSAGGRALFVGGASGAVSLWSGDGQLLWRRETDGKAVRAVAVRGDLLASGNDRGDIHIWRHDGSLAHRRDLAHDGAIVSLAISDDGAVLVSEGTDTMLRAWRIDTASWLVSLASYREASQRYRRMLPNLIRWDVAWGWDRSIAFAPGADADIFAASTLGGGLQLWRAGGELIAERADSHDGHHVRAVAFSPRGDRIASGGLDGTVRLWESASLGEPRILRGHLRAVSAVAFDRSGRIASSSIDGTVRLWTATGESLGALPHHSPPSPPRGPLPRAPRRRKR